jgi:hypothetical protein
MRWRVAALVALSGMVAVPAVSDALQPRTASVSVSVKPHNGSNRTRFAVSFQAATSTGGSFHNTYRVTASRQGNGVCQSSTAVSAPATKAGSTVHVVLAPSRSKRWCVGTFKGQVWEQLVIRCPPGVACPALEPAPQMVGKFSFRVTRG